MRLCIGFFVVGFVVSLFQAYGVQPNFIVLVTDEERYVPPHEAADPRVKRFFKHHLKARSKLFKNGIVFDRHYIASSACSPSRASLFTGQYPGTHHLTQTYLMSKDENHPDIHWLKPKELPTMGDIFRVHGYETVYKGKWHISLERLFGKDQTLVETIMPDGTPIPRNEARYLKANLLDKFGFDGWIGPEPHGLLEQYTGSVTDPHYARQVIEFLSARSKDTSDTRPFLLVASLVNPHDICFYAKKYGESLFGMTRLYDESVPHLPLSPSVYDDLSTKPSVQAGFKTTMQDMVFHSKFISERIYRPEDDTLVRHYYDLMKKVDQEMQAILHAVETSPFAHNTYILWTSDHGDLLGSHGLQQKMHAAYDEVIHVPMVVSSPLLKHPGSRVDQLSNHVDILPTMAGLAGMDMDATLEELKKTHSRVLPLPGKDLSPLIFDPSLKDPMQEAVYFHTDDQISEGNNLLPIVFRLYTPSFTHSWWPHYAPLKGASHIETVITRLRGDLYKLSRYFDPKKSYKDEWEMYHMTRDPHELKNLIHAKGTSELFKELFDILTQERAKKRVVTGDL